MASDSAWFFNTSYSGKGKVFATYDAGRSYSLILETSPANDALTFDTSTQTLFALTGDGRLCVSLNLGRSWSYAGNRINFSSMPGKSHLCDLTSAVIKSRRVFFASSGYPGRIYLSRDTGTTWQTAFDDSAFRFMEIPRVELMGGKLIACSAEGIIEREGALLVADSIGGRFAIKSCPKSLWSFDLIQGTRIAVGSFTLKAGRSVLVTQDFGSTWSASLDEMPGLVWKIEAIDSNVVLLATDSGLIRYRLFD